jgi:hypothetical protein
LKCLEKLEGPCYVSDENGSNTKNTDTADKNTNSFFSDQTIELNSDTNKS